MLWLLITILAYFILAVVFLVDKYLLTSGIPNPKLYAFFSGFAGLSLLVLIPFIHFVIPGPWLIILSFIGGAAYVYALYWFFKGLREFDASRIVPATGGLVPVFSFIFIYLSSFGKAKLGDLEFLAFIILIIGSILISVEREKLINKKSLKFSLLASLFFAFSFVLRKYVYLAIPFLSGLIWTTMGGVIVAFILLIFSSDIRRDIFKPKENFQKKTIILFVANQMAGGGGGFLQNWAIALAPLAYVSIINALQGTQYALLFILTIILSLKFPQIIKEEISKKIVYQKIIAILLISVGLALLVI